MKLFQENNGKSIWSQIDKKRKKMQKQNKNDNWSQNELRRF